MEKRLKVLESEFNALDHGRLNINVRPGTAIFHTLSYMVAERKLKAML